MFTKLSIIRGTETVYLKIIGGTLKSRKLYNLNGSDENLKIRGLKTFYSGDEIDVDEVLQMIQ